MERRNFLKTGLLAMLSLHGFSEKTLCFAGEILSQSDNSTKGYHTFRGVYFSTLTDERIFMPDAFSRRLQRERFVMFAFKGNKFLLLMPENNPEWEATKEMLDVADREGFPVLHEHAEIDGAGRLCLPGRVRAFAEIRSTKIAIAGRPYAIEITDSELYHSHIV